MSKQIYVQFISDDKSDKTGLNISEIACTHSYYTIEELHHLYFYKFDKLIRIIKVPDDAKITTKRQSRYLNSVSNEYIDLDFYTSDKIIVCQTYPLYDIKTAIALNLKITPKYIKNMCDLANTDVLDKVDIWNELKNSGLKFEYDNYVLEWASQNGLINVLEWWKNSGLELKYNERALTLASHYGHVAVLEWWKQSGLELKYDEAPLDWASSNGQVAVLEWWKQSGLELKYSAQSLCWASQNGHLGILEWWKNSGLPLKHFNQSILIYAKSVDILNWWKTSLSPVQWVTLRC
jgi:hypothetical protein